MANDIYIFYGLHKEEMEARQKMEMEMKRQKEEEIRKFPFKKKGFRKHIK